MQATTEWTLSGAVLADLSPTVTRLSAPTALTGATEATGTAGADGACDALVAGFLRGAKTLEERRAAIYRVRSPEEAERVYEGPGWIAALDRRGEQACAVLATPSPEGAGATYRLLRSEDGGRTFKDGAPIPARSVAQLLLAGPDELWVLGGGTLLRSADGGATWAQVYAPGDRDPASERLAFEGGATLLLGRGVRVTTDGGATWSHLDFDGHRIGAVSGRMVAAWSEGGTVRLGSREDGRAVWFTEIDKPMRPFCLQLQGDRATFLAVPVGEGLSKGLYLYESQDAGATWQAAQLHCAPQTAVADLGPGGVGLAVDPKGRLLTRGWA